MKPGRNDPCSCGSGKKFKLCCAGKSTTRIPTPSSNELNQLIALFNNRRFIELEHQSQSLVGRYPKSGLAWKLLAASLQMQGKNALPALHKTSELMPGDTEAQYKLGVALYQSGQPVEALASYRRVVELNPKSAEAHNNYAVVLFELGRYQDAVTYCRRAVGLKPDFAEAHNNLGTFLKELGLFKEALASYRQALSLNPDNFKAHGNVSNLLKDMGQIEAAIASYRSALAINANSAEAHSNLLFTYNYSSSYSPTFYLEQALQFGLMATALVTQPYTEWKCAAEPGRLRVGLVSGDFKTHSVGHFLEGLLSRISPAEIELYAYPTTHQEDDLTLRIRPSFSVWRPLAGMTDEAAALQIHNDGIHVLIDVSGHTAHNRLPVFAWKPAPVQVTWLGLPCTSGLTQMDYILGDLQAIPTAHEKHFSETVWRLPDCYLCFSTPAYPLEVSSLPAISSGVVTFGSFNNLTKMNDDVVDEWSKILDAVPNSRLYLKSAQLNDVEVREQTLTRFSTKGIAPERLILVGKLGTIAEHLAEYNKIDIALDTFPYPGVTTSIEAMWMGVPVLTLRGDRFLSLTATSIAHHAGLSEWIAEDKQDYIAKAVSLSRDFPELTVLRANLRKQVLASPLFDANRFAKNFESALWAMWQQYLKHSIIL